MASTRQGGPGIALPPLYPYYNDAPITGQPNWVNVGVGPLTLQAGAVQLVPAGQYWVSPGSYTQLQLKDPVQGNWRTINAGDGGAKYVSSDGANYRLANLSGCAVGAFITNVGSGYTSAPTVTASAGGSTWTAIVGGAISTTVTVAAAGSGYTYAPIVVISAPPAGGVQATAYSTLSGATLGSITVTNQGAGYTAAPTVTIIRDPRDTGGSGARATTALTGSGTITAVICTYSGTPLTSVPTLAFSGGGGASAAATVVGCYAATGFTVGAGGAAYGNAQPFLIITGGGVTAGTAGAVVNPSIGPGMFVPRQANITGVSTGGGAITATAAVVNDAGLFQAVPSGFVIAGGSGLATTVGQATITIGGVVDTSLVFVA